MRQNPPTCQKSREEVLMENSFRTTEHFDDGDDDHFPASSHKVIAMVIEFFKIVNSFDMSYFCNVSLMYPLSFYLYGLGKRLRQ